MRKIKYPVKKLKDLFHEKKILTLGEIQKTLGTTAKMTLNRKLKSISAITSYSHTGKYYSLDELAQYNQHGVWEHNCIRFSKHGPLTKTLECLIDKSDAGYFASELKEILKIFVYNALLSLFLSEKVLREQIGAEYLYLSTTIWEVQLDNRKRQIQESTKVKTEPYVKIYDSKEIECLKMLLSVLNEKQRRLFLGFESIRLGYGGNKILSLLTGIDARTIAKGRKELLSHDIIPEKIRRVGGGRKSLKKKRTS